VASREPARGPVGLCLVGCGRISRMHLPAIKELEKRGEAALVAVEVDVTPGLPAFTVVGLPDSTVRESRDRVKSAIRNAGYAFPMERITVSLAPADLRKEGAAFDLPVALGILGATGCLKREPLAGLVVLGELALDGEVRAVRGVLPVALACRRAGVAGLLLPQGNGREAEAPLHEIDRGD